MNSCGTTFKYSKCRRCAAGTHELRHPQASKNVVMVWTKGCMDRFLDGSDTADTDFVRKEYRLAMQLKKNMVAVKHEEFVFPDAASVPEEIRPVLKINAVPWISQYKDAGLKKLMDSLILS